MVLPFSNASGSVRRWTMPLPLATSSSRLGKPWTRLAPLVSLVRLNDFGVGRSEIGWRDRRSDIGRAGSEPSALRAVVAVADAPPSREAASRQADRRRGSRGNKHRPAIPARRSGGRAASRSACRTARRSRNRPIAWRRRAGPRSSPRPHGEPHGELAGGLGDRERVERQGRLAVSASMTTAEAVSRLTIIRMTWLVPSRIEWTRRSRQKRSIG